MAFNINNLVNNFGTSNPFKDPKGVLAIQTANTNQQLAQQTAALQGTDTAKASNAQAGFKQERVPPPASNFNNGVPVKVDLDRIIPEGKNQDIVLTGTTVNDPQPISGVAVDTTTMGTPSLFNDYWLVHYNSLAGKEKPINFLEKSEKEPYTGLAFDANYKNPTTSRIIEVFNGEGNGVNPWTKPEKKYTYSDFLYLKHYHPYNNNRLITLRRFLRPVLDDCTMPVYGPYLDDAKRRLQYPIAKALSYLGTSGNSLSALANFTVTIKVKDVGGNLTDKPTMVEPAEFEKLAPFNKGKNAPDNTSFGYGLLVALSGAGEDKTAIDAWATKMDTWTNGAYADLIHGPVNVITGAKVRDRGLTYNHQINLNFEYSTKAIERINPKAAMLDIISNMLAMSYHHGNFFGGENRFQFNKTNFAFLDNEKGSEFLKKLAQGGEKGANEALKEYVDSMSKAGSNVLAGAKRIADGLISGNGLNDDAVKKLFETAAKVGSRMQTGLQALNKTIQEGTKSTLNGSPTGEWHLQVGNPFAPIMMIGNLWCTSATFTFNDDLSADDFPTDLKVNLKLEYGRQRDASDIQSMFNNGVGRIYYPYKNVQDANKSSTYYNTEYVFKQKPSDDKNAYLQVTPTDTITSKKEDYVNKVKVGAAVETYQTQNTSEKNK